MMVRRIPTLWQTFRSLMTWKEIEELSEKAADCCSGNQGGETDQVVGKDHSRALRALRDENPFRMHKILLMRWRFDTLNWGKSDLPQWVDASWPMTIPLRDWIAWWTSLPEWRRQALNVSFDRHPWMRALFAKTAAHGAMPVLYYNGPAVVADPRSMTYRKHALSVVKGQLEASGCDGLTLSLKTSDNRLWLHERRQSGLRGENMHTYTDMAEWEQVTNLWLSELMDAGVPIVTIEQNADDRMWTWMSDDVQAWCWGDAVPVRV